jgi:hypothetical protein
MLKYLRPGKRKARTEPDPVASTLRRLSIAPDLPISLRSINELPENAKQRIYRSLIPRDLLIRYDLDPITWKGPDKETYGSLKAKPGSGVVYLKARSPFDPDDPFYVLEISDNKFNRIDLNLIVLSDPDGERFDTDVDSAGKSTLFGTVRRNLVAEERAARSGDTACFSSIDRWTRSAMIRRPAAIL